MIKIAEAPLGGAVTDDGDVVTDDSGSAVVIWEGLPSLSAPAEVEKDKAETPCFDHWSGEGTPKGDAKDLNDVAAAVAVRWGPENGRSTTAPSLRGPSAAAVKGDLNAGEHRGAASDVCRRTGDNDFALVADPGLRDEVRPNQVAVLTGEEGPMCIGPVGSFTGNGEPSVPVHPVSRGLGGGDGGEHLAGQAGAADSGNMRDGLLGVGIPAGLVRAASGDPSLSRGRQLTKVASSAGGGSPDGDVVGPKGDLAIVEGEVELVIPRVIDRVETSSTGNEAPSRAPVDPGSAIEGPIEKDDMLTESEEPVHLDPIVVVTKGDVRNLGKR